MKKSVQPSILDGTVSAPASKSMMQRAVAAALLTEGTTRIHNPAASADALASLEAASCLGATVRRVGESVEISGGLGPRYSTVDCGEAGLCLRMFTPIAALSHRKLSLTGKPQLRRRPVHFLEKPLSDLGAACTTTSGYPPITVQGPLAGGTTTVDGSLSSQFLTGLLLALPRAPLDSEIRVENLRSVPYIDMTLTLLIRCGIEVQHDGYRIFSIPGNQSYRFDDYTVEGDWSGASFLLVAAAVAGSVTVSGLDDASTQADRGILTALDSAGAELTIKDTDVTVRRSQLKAFEFDATHCPDLFPPLVALASYCDGSSRIHGVSRLRHKESDRASVLCREFTALGGSLEIGGNALVVHGGRLRGGRVNPHNDHRIAMAAAVAALGSAEGIVIDDAGCVDKSYPDFYQDLMSIGGVVNE
jgi:3-phosphoshikimate 1-carboxyvinyltransferase